jgi:hypothetical protein
MKSNQAVIMIASWAFRVIAVIILGQTLFFKFSGAAESRYIFATLGAEPWGRIASGLAELCAIGLLLLPRTAALGALLTAALMMGAVGAHLTRLGIVVRNDGGLLFALAVTVLACSLAILAIHRSSLVPIARLAWLQRSSNRCACDHAHS